MYLGYDKNGNIVRYGHGEERLMGSSQAQKNSVPIDVLIEDLEQRKENNEEYVDFDELREELEYSIKQNKNKSLTFDDFTKYLSEIAPALTIIGIATYFYIRSAERADKYETTYTTLGDDPTEYKITQAGVHKLNQVSNLLDRLIPNAPIEGKKRIMHSVAKRISEGNYER